MTSVEENLNAMQEIIDVVDLAKLKATNLREEHLLWIQHKIANSLMYLKNGMKSGKGPYSLNDVLSDIATNLEEIANGPIRKTPIFQFLEEFEQKCRSENQDTALVQIKSKEDLVFLEKFCDLANKNIEEYIQNIIHDEIKRIKDEIQAIQ